MAAALKLAAALSSAQGGGVEDQFEAWNGQYESVYYLCDMICEKYISERLDEGVVASSRL